MKNKNESVSLAFCEGNSDKVYHLALEQKKDGFIVTAQYGRRGGPLSTDSKTKSGPIEYDDAKKIFDRVVREKKAKGYTEAGEAPLPQVEPPTHRVGGGGFELRRQELLEETTQPAHFMANDKYWMQDKSDGHARGAVKQGSIVFGLNKLSKQVALPAEIVKELRKIDHDFQIDAEIVGDKLICRDLLYMDGDISAKSYQERFSALVSALMFADDDNDNPFRYVSVVETWQGSQNKLNALERSVKERREGVVFKRIDAPHKPGRSGQHKKYKFVKTASVIAGNPRANGKDSVEIFLIDGGNRKPSNSRGTFPNVPCCRVGTVSLIGKPQVREGDVLEVAYLYAFPSNMLCQARMLSIRDDVEQRECTTKQLIYKREQQ